MKIDIKGIDSSFEEVADIIRKSFATVANEFNLTKENAPTNPAFTNEESLLKMKEKGIGMYCAYVNSRCVGFVAIQKASEDIYYMERLAVLPEHRNNGYGKGLIDYVVKYVMKNGGNKISIGIINENKVLKNWYIKNGFVEVGKKVFPHLPFEVCFMEKVV